jgi:hypothetical protein
MTNAPTGQRRRREDPRCPGELKDRLLDLALIVLADRGDEPGSVDRRRRQESSHVSRMPESREPDLVAGGLIRASCLFQRRVSAVAAMFSTVGCWSKPFT